jgi:hypothetical protein
LTIQYRISVSTSPDMTVPQRESSGFFMVSSVVVVRGFRPPATIRRPAWNRKWFMRCIDLRPAARTLGQP